VNIDLEGAPGPNGRPPRGKFEFDGVRVFLTYSQTTITYDDIRAALEENIGWHRIKEWWISREQHEDGGLHWHVLLAFKQRLHIRDARWLFDVFEAHPNIAKVTDGPKSWNALKAYVAKDGVLWSGQRFDWSKPNNFRRNLQDYKSWGRQLEANRASNKPLRSFFEMPGLTMDAACREARLPPRVQSLWIWGKALVGKSTYAQTQLVRAQAAVYCRSSGRYPYDDYCGQQVIYCDDMVPTKEEICNVLTAHLLEVPVWGNNGTRYSTIYWPKNLDLSMLVISNQRPPYCGRDWFDTRFLVWHVTNKLY